MTGGLEFDTVIAGSMARAWSRWGDHLHHAASALALDLEVLELGARASAVCDHVGAAATHLWTVGTFTDQVRADVVRADGRLALGSSRLAVLIERVVVAVGRSSADRAAAGRRWAELERLRAASPAEVRRYFEGIERADPVEVLARLIGDEALLYWKALDASEHAVLATTRPDLVVLHVLAAGAELSAELLASMEASTAFETFESSLGIDVDVSIGLKVIQVDLGGGIALTVTKLSDGTVEMLLVEGLHVGGGQEGNVPGATSAGWAIGAAAEFQQKFAFDDEAQATAAIETLRVAIARDVSLSEISVDLCKGSFNRLAEVVNAPSRLWNLTNHVPLLDRLPDAPSVPTFDLTPELAQALQRLWDDHGLEQVAALGAYASADAEFDSTVAALSAAADASVMFYDQDARAGSSGRGRTGAVIVGSVELDGGTDPHGAAAANFAVDIHHLDGAGLEMTLLLSGQIGNGTTAQLFELGSAGLSTSRDQTLVGTIEMVVPIDDASDVATLVAVLSAGALPVDDIRRLYDRSEVSVTLRRGTSTSAEFELDAGVVSVDATAASSESETMVALHKYPGGDMHDRFEVDRILGRARDES